LSWKVITTDRFDSWWDGLSDDEQASVDAYVQMLEEKGPTLPFPYSSGVNGSKHSHMRELRIQHAGSPYRVLYAFDPNRDALLLVGGNKTGDGRWYRKYISIADKEYDDHLKDLAK
jgi:hypothetical protein